MSCHIVERSTLWLNVSLQFCPRHFTESDGTLLQYDSALLIFPTRSSYPQSNLTVSAKTIACIDDQGLTLKPEVTEFQVISTTNSPRFLTTAHLSGRLLVNLAPDHVVSESVTLSGGSSARCEPEHSLTLATIDWGRCKAGLRASSILPRWEEPLTTMQIGIPPLDHGERNSPAEKGRVSFLESEEMSCLQTWGHVVPGFGSKRM